MSEENKTFSVHRLYTQDSIHKIQPKAHLKLIIYILRIVCHHILQKLAFE